MGTVSRLIEEKEARVTNLWKMIRAPIMKETVTRNDRKVYPSVYWVYSEVYEEELDPIEIILGEIDPKKTTLHVFCDNEYLIILVWHGRKIIGTLNVNNLNPIMRTELFWHTLGRKYQRAE